MTDMIRLKQQEAVLRLLFQNEHKGFEKLPLTQKNVAMKRDCLRSEERRVGKECRL